MSLFRVIECHRMNSVHIITFYEHYEQISTILKKLSELTASFRYFYFLLSPFYDMSPKADYWRNFLVADVLANCQISGCPKPNVSLGCLPKPGKKKGLSKYWYLRIATHS